MPYRSLASVKASYHRLFHTSAVLHSTHYETLHIPITASPQEIKTAFYRLSKLSHPDRNPSDPSASHRFVRISEAYATLRSAEKRLRYDREIGVVHNHHHRGAPTTAAGAGAAAAGRTQSHYGPAGGRAPSGLSRRRGTFRGAPASFYRSGGWGEYSAKRRAAQEGGGAAGMEGGGLGYGQSAWGWSGEEARHFDRESHLRTHINQERRMRGRARVSREEGGREGGMLGNFLLVGGLIFGGVMGPSWALGYLGKRTGRKDVK